MPFKTKRQIQGKKVWLNRRIKAGFVSISQDPKHPEPTITHNPSEPLLEVFKEEPMPVIPVTTHQPLSEVLLVIGEPKSEPTNPISEVPLFCTLCLRPCTSGQVVEFSAEPSWNWLDVASGRDKLALILGLELELEQSAICRSCWIMVETLADFREGCLKAAKWRARFSFGLDGAGDEWQSKEQVELMEWTRKVVQEHVERIEMAEVEARNKQDSGVNEFLEEKPVLEGVQDWAEDASDPDSPEELPNNDHPSETAEIVNKTEITEFSCEKCQQKFETKSDMTIHHKNCKKSCKKKPEAGKLHICPVCSANFTHTSRLEEHVNRHLGNKPYVCRKGNCNQRLYGYNQRRTHESRCKGNNSLNPNMEQEFLETVKIQPEIAVYSCDKCPRKFSNKAGLKRHASRCKILTCEICAMKFSHHTKLDAHMNKHNGIKPYKCTNETCGKCFYGKIGLYRHSTVCGKDKAICPLCGVQLASKATLKLHMVTHAEEANAECDTCGKKFKTKKGLKKHQLVHSDERNYPCGVCGKALKSANALNVHQRIHTQEKPFSCTVCGQGFAYKCLVKPHMMKCRGGEN